MPRAASHTARSPRGSIGIAIFPWKLLESAGTYIFAWLVGYSALLGPIAGIMICDYYLARRRHLVVEDLYRRVGMYEYHNGFNPRAIAALVVGVAVALIGLAVPGLRLLYDYAWFVGFFISGGLYFLLMHKQVPPAK